MPPELPEQRKPYKIETKESETNQFESFSMPSELPEQRKPLINHRLDYKNNRGSQMRSNKQPYQNQKPQKADKQVSTHCDSSKSPSTHQVDKETTVTCSFGSLETLKEVDEGKELILK